MPQRTDEHFPFAFAVLLASFIALSVCPLLFGDILPMVDAGQHLRQAALLSRWSHDPNYSQWFTLSPVPTPHWLWPHLVAWTGKLTGIEAAARTWMALGMVALPLCTLALLKAAGHSRWLVLAVLPWAWNGDVLWGYLATTLALPLFVGLVAAHLSLSLRPRWWKALLTTLLLSVLAVTHYAHWLAGLLLLPLLSAIVQWRRGKGIAALVFLRDAALALPSLLLIVPWLTRTLTWPRSLAAIAPWYTAEHRLPLDNLRQAADSLFDRFQPHAAHLEAASDLWLRRPGDVLSGLWLLGVALWLLGAVRQPHEIRQEGYVDDTTSRDGSRYLGWAAALMAGLYLVLPKQITSPLQLFNVNQRLVAAAAIVAMCALPLRVLAPTPRARRRVWVGTVLLTVVAAGVPLLAVQAQVIGTGELEHMREAYARLPKGAAVLTVRDRPYSAWLQTSAVARLGEWWDVLQGGYTPEGFADPQLQPVRWKPSARRPSPTRDDHADFGMHDHGRFYDFVAVYHDPFAPSDPFAAQLAALPEVFHRGRWRVFQVLQREPWPPLPPDPVELSAVPTTAAGVLH